VWAQCVACVVTGRCSSQVKSTKRQHFALRTTYHLSYRSNRWLLGQWGGRMLRFPPLAPGKLKDQAAPIRCVNGGHEITGNGRIRNVPEGYPRTFRATKICTTCYTAYMRQQRAEKQKHNGSKVVSRLTVVFSWGFFLKFHH
jgi:hypothetical protein